MSNSKCKPLSFYLKDEFYEIRKKDFDSACATFRYFQTYIYIVLSLILSRYCKKLYQINVALMSAAPAFTSISVHILYKYICIGSVIQLIYTIPPRHTMLMKFSCWLQRGTVSLISTGIRMTTDLFFSLYIILHFFLL